MSKLVTLRSWTATAAAVLGLAGGAIALTGSPGALDTDFGTGGYVRTAGAGMPWAVVPQSDGKILFVGQESLPSGTHRWRVRRYLSDGSLDAGFGSGGAATAFGDLPLNSQATGAAVDSFGRIVATGQTAVEVTTSGKKPTTTQIVTLALARWDANGSLDSTFGTGGQVKTVLSGALFAAGWGIAVQGDGKVVVAGRAQYPGARKNDPSHYAQFVARYTSSGALDGSFGTGGITVYDPTTKDDYAFPDSLGIQSSGKIVVGGRLGGVTSGGTSWAITRYLPNGQRDTSFAVTSTVRALNRITVDGADRIVATGSAMNGSVSDGIVARYLPDGAPDTSFGDQGAMFVGFPAGGTLLKPAVQADGKVVVAATFRTSASAPAGAAVVRLTSSGSLDSSYGNGGYGEAILAPASSLTESASCAIAADGGILFGGRFIQNGAADWLLARHQSQ